MLFLQNMLIKTRQKECKYTSSQNSAGGLPYWSEAFQLFLCTYVTEYAILDAIYSLEYLCQVWNGTEILFASRIDNGSYCIEINFSTVV